MSSLFDSPSFNERLFFPRREAVPLPAGATSLRVIVEPGVSLECRVHPHPSAKVAVLLFTGNGEAASDWDRFAPAFHRVGAAPIVVSYRGYGSSGGAPSLRSALSDARVVAGQVNGLLERAGVPLPLVVMGRSLGSASAAEVAGSCPSVCSGVVIESGFSDLRAFVARRGLSLPGGIDERDEQAFSPLGKLARSRAPLLVLHGAGDALIAPSESRASYQASGSRERSLSIVEGRGHNDVMLSDSYWSALGAFFARVAERADRSAGAMIGQALGDALGFLVEGHHPIICAAFVAEVFSSEAPPSRRKGGLSFGQYSDDTQLARELSRSLVERGGWSAPDFAARVARLFETGAVVGRGRATESAAARLSAGVPWHEAGEPSPSAGNGAAMRAAPVGLAFADARQRAVVADEQARVTHRDPRARAAALLVAESVAAAASGLDEGALCEAVSEAVAALDPELARGVLALPSMRSMPADQAAAAIARWGSSGEAPAGHERWHGISPFATPSALYALHAFLCSPGDLEQVLACSVAVGGDVDTVAAMAGAIAGARVGLSGFSPRLRAWAELLEDQGADRMRDLVLLAQGLLRALSPGACWGCLRRGPRASRCRAWT